MRGDYLAFAAVPLTSGLLFLSAPLAGATAFLGIACYLQHKGFFRLIWKAWPRFSRQAPAGQQIPADVGAETEPTLITMVARAPYQLLGVERDAGTSTIFHTFYERMKEGRNEGLKLTKQGRRLTAAKNAMFSQRRRGMQPKRTARPRSEIDDSLRDLLEDRPVFKGKAVQYLNLSSAALESYKCGVEIEVSGTFQAAEKGIGRGSSRLIVQSQDGRLLSTFGEEQIAFLPGSRFLVVKREPWKNPAFPDSLPGFTFELVEVE